MRSCAFLYIFICHKLTPDRASKQGHKSRDQFLMPNQLGVVSTEVLAKQIEYNENS